MHVADPAWAEVSKEQWRVQTQSLEEDCTLGENCSPRTVSNKRQHCKAVPQSGRKTTCWSWGFYSLKLL